MLNAREANNVPGMVAARKEMKEWNEKMVREGKPAMRIKLEDVQRRMTARRREAKATPKNAAKGKAFAEVWGRVGRKKPPGSVGAFFLASG